MPDASITTEIVIPELSRACLISNADSGANLAYGLGDVEQTAREAGLRHERLEDIDELSGLLRASAHRDDHLIVVNAGDGTVRRVLEHLRNDNCFSSEPALALLRGGTTNMIHNDVGIKGRPQNALRDLLAAMGNGRCAYRQRHVLRVGAPSLSRPRYGFFLGTNAIVKRILRTRAELHQRVSTGRLSELLSVGQMAWRLLLRRVNHDPTLSPVPLALRRDQGPWQRTAHILFMAITLRTAILGIRPLQHGQQSGLAVLNWPEYRLLPWLWRLSSGRLEAFGSVSLRGTFDWVLDGEIYSHGEDDGVLTIEVDAPVRFLVPGTP